MQRIIYDGTSLVTSELVASAVMAYATDVVRLATSAAVQVPVLEANGTIVQHTILLGPATQLEVVDIDGDANAVSEEDFPLPDLPPLILRAAPVPSAREDLLPDVEL